MASSANSARKELLTSGISMRSNVFKFTYLLASDMKDRCMYNIIFKRRSPARAVNVGLLAYFLAGCECIVGTLLDTVSPIGLALSDRPRSRHFFLHRSSGHQISLISIRPIRARQPVLFIFGSDTWSSLAVAERVSTTV
jgi:hypothetical protein